MGLENSIKTAIEWVRKEPAVLLPGLLNWIPALILSLLLIQVAPGIQAILAENPQNPIQALLSHSSELLALVLSALGILILLSIVGFVLQSIVYLTLAACAGPLRNGKELKIGEALCLARNKLGRYLGAQLLLFLAVSSVILDLILIGVLLLISVVGIILLVLLIIPTILAFVLAIVALSALLLFLPAVIIYGNPSGAWDSIKQAWAFVDRNKMGAALLVILVMATHAVFNSIAQAAGLFGGSILGLLVQLVVGTLAMLVATAYWIEEKGNT